MQYRSKALSCVLSLGLLSCETTGEVLDDAPLGSEVSVSRPDDGARLPGPPDGGVQAPAGDGGR